MSSLIKFGAITRVLQMKPPRYEVRLDNGQTVVVRHGQIRPARQTALRIGARMAVFEIGGQVKWASTDLTSRKDLPMETTPGPEIISVVVVNSEPGSGIVTFRGANGAQIRLRLPMEHSIWQVLYIGLETKLQVAWSANGSRKYRVMPPADAVPPKEDPDDSPRRSEDPGAGPARQAAAPVSGRSADSSKETRPGVNTSQLDASSPERARENPNSESNSNGSSEAGRIGIDPVYFQAREQESHRHEIMAFLAEHLHDDLIEWYQMREATDAKYANPGRPLDLVVGNTLRTLHGQEFQLFNHQARALDIIRSGRNVVVVTQTASGKTLCYNPAIFEHFIHQDRSACALYIFPLNALMMDQKEKIDEVRKLLASKGVKVDAELLKGGLGTTRRHEIARLAPNILAVNPEMLSVMLNEPHHWQSFFASLRYVVVDEVHSYRGLFGLHMAGILRRLLLQVRRLKSQPQFILSSATVSNPMDLAVRLTALPENSFDLLSEKDDGSRQAHKHWVVVNPDAHANGNGYDNHLATAASVMAELLSARGKTGHPSPLNTVLFAKSIRDVNKAYNLLQENLRDRPDLSQRIRKYVSAELNFAEKREIYEGLKSGKYVGVVSTNALEAGIDIGKLDACIVAGFPFFVMRMRQMAGRVGRQQEGLVAFVPQSVSAVDQFYRLSPTLLLDQPPEVFVVDPENSYIARKHMNAAAYSLRGLDEAELMVFGAHAQETAQKAIADGVMSRNGTRYFGTKRNFSDKSDPYAVNSIRSNAQIPYTMCQAGDGKCSRAAECLETGTGRKCENLVTTLDRQYAYRDCHPGAIYEGPDATQYEVRALDDADRVIHVHAQPENTLERTFVEEDVSVKILGAPRMTKILPGGVEAQVGEVLVTRSFTGYYTYELVLKSYCRSCRREFDATQLFCSICGRKNIRSHGQSKPKRQDFPSPYNQAGFHITLRTVACWVKVPAELENRLNAASPCKLPGDENRVASFLKRPLQIDRIAPNPQLSESENQLIRRYHEAAGEALRQRPASSTEAVLYPGVYGQCLLGVLREQFPEGRSLQVFQAATGYPVTDELRHVCRKCQTSVLLPAMHTLEHTIMMRYPSVALGDSTDLGSYTRLGHPDTGAPTIFWYDNYDGGLGAAERVFERFDELLSRSEQTVVRCTCTSLEGCPNCTHIGHCDLRNESLSKAAVMALISILQGRPFRNSFEPFVYRKAESSRFRTSYQENQYVREDHGIGEEEPASQKESASPDPHQILRVQHQVHDPVLEKAYEIRGQEITNEVPTVSVLELNQAYHRIKGSKRPVSWNISAGMDPFRILEILPVASLSMIQKIYHVIARQVHPDVYRGDKSKANEMMKLLNVAFEKARKEKRKEYSGDDSDF